MHLLPYNCVNTLDNIITVIRERVWFRAGDIVRNKTSVTTDEQVWLHIHRHIQLPILQIRDNVKSS